MALSYTHSCLAQLPSEKLLPAVDGNQQTACKWPVWREWENLEHSILSEMFPPNSSSLWQRRWKDRESQRGRGTPRNHGLPNTAGLMRIWTHCGGGSMRRACTACASCPSAGRKPRSISNWQLLIKEKLAFSNGVSLGIQTTPKGKHHAQKHMANRKLTQWHSFIKSYRSSVYILWFLILCFYGNPVCKRVSRCVYACFLCFFFGSFLLLVLSYSKLLFLF